MSANYADYDDGLTGWVPGAWSYAPEDAPTPPRELIGGGVDVRGEPLPYPSGVFTETQLLSTRLYRKPKQHRQRRKSRILAGLLQLFLPGVGRAYLGNDKAFANRLLGAWGIGSLLCLSIIGCHIGIPLLVYAHVASLVDGLLILTLGVDYREKP